MAGYPIQLHGHFHYCSSSIPKKKKKKNHKPDSVHDNIHSPRQKHIHLQKKKKKKMRGVRRKEPPSRPIRLQLRLILNYMVHGAWCMRSCVHMSSAFFFCRFCFSLVNQLMWCVISSGPLCLMRSINSKKAKCKCKCNALQCYAMRITNAVSLIESWRDD